jgi:hypothetical protein
MHRPAAFPPATAPTNPGLLNSRGEEHPPTPKKTLLFQNREENPLEEQRISDRHFCTAFIPPLAVSAKTAEKRAWATVNKVSGGGKKSGSGKA